MSNQRNLKAFVRFDGSGRVVAGSLVLRKNKPKVGRWKEIQAYECCNYVPTTTTTSSTSTTSTTTTIPPGPGSNILYSNVSQLNACDGIGSNMVVHWGGTTLCDSSVIYGTFTGLTTFWISTGGNVRQFTTFTNTAANAVGACVACG